MIIADIAWPSPVCRPPISRKGTECRRAISVRCFSARARHSPSFYEMRGWTGQGDKVGILFGPERTGLENDDMVHADTVLSIPVNPQFSSLNVAQAVLLVAYEWAAAGEGKPAERMSDHSTRPATKDELANLFAHLERALDESGFLRNKAMRPAMVNNLRALLQRSAMTEQEVRSFHGVIKYLAKHKHSEE